MKNIAVLFTGQYRTFDKTYTHILNNLLKPNNAKAFIYCETDIYENDFLFLLKQRWPEEYIGKVCCVQDSKTKEYEQILEYLLKNKEALKKEYIEKFNYKYEYIQNGGSILEHYQYMKCFDLMIKYEKEHNIKFDIIMRCRLDIVLTQQINILSFFNKLDEELLKKCGSEIYIRSLGNEVMANNILNNKLKSEYGYDIKLGKNNYNSLKNNEILYTLKNENIIWTLYANWLMIGRREVMNELYSFIFYYGSFITNKYCGFNSEIQLCEYLIHKNINILYYYTYGEASMWYKQDNQKYDAFNIDNSLKDEINCSDVIIFICRR